MYLAYIISLLLILSSAWLWLRFLIAPSAFPLAQKKSHGPVPNPFIANAITLLLVTGGLYAIYGKERPPLQIGMKELAESNLQSAFIAVTLLSLLMITFQRLASFDEYGITDEKLGRQLIDGLYGFLLAIIPVTAMRVLSMPFLTEEGMHPLIKLVINSDSVVLWGHVVFAAVIIAPLAEELMYRVIIQSWLRKSLSAAPSIILSALLFSLMHGPQAAIALMPLALLLGYLYETRHSYFACVTTHMLFNGINLLMLMLAPETMPSPPSQ